MPDLIETLTVERETLDSELEQINERAGAEFRALTDPETGRANELLTRIATIDDRLGAHVAQLEGRRRAGALIEKAAGFAPTATRPAVGVEQRSPGERFVESTEFRDYRGHGQSGHVELAGYLETRAAILTTALAIPHALWPPREPGLTEVSPLLELCDRVTVSSGVVDWVEVGADPVAAVVAEGAAKPEAAFTMTPKTATLDTIAHWMQISRQALDDASYIRGLIEGKLRRGLVRKAEADMAAALVAAVLPTATTSTAAGGNLLKSIRKGIGTVEAAGYRPNAVVLNPADYASIDVDVMAVTDAGPVRTSGYWGVTPVAVSSQPAGTATVGDFRTGAVLFDRGVSSVFVTDSHASLFISNILVILAEARLKSVITDLGAFCECSVVA